MKRNLVCAALGLITACGSAPEAGERVQPIPFDAQTELGFSGSEMRGLGDPGRATLEWRGPSVGFFAIPASGTTGIEWQMAYGDGAVLQIGDPAYTLTVEAILTVKTEDGALDETVTGTIRARDVEDWTFAGERSRLSGSFQVIEQPAPSFRYAFFLRRDHGVTIGAVGAVASAEEALPDGARTGTATGFVGGNWVSQ